MSSSLSGAVWFLASLLAAPPGSASAEPARVVPMVAAQLAGKVTTPDGRPLEGAIVSIPALQRTTTTGPTGEYRLDGLPAAAVTVQVRAIGRRAETREVRLVSGQVTRLDVVLEESVVEVAGIVVTGTPAGSTQLSPLDVHAVEPEQMRATATASLGKTLESVPGVSNLSQGPAAGNPVLRGMSQGHIRIVRDGVPQENFQATARWFPPGNMAGVERVEVVRGPAGVLYGPNAVGGAVNLIPRPLPQRVDGRPALGGLAEAQYYTNNHERYGHAEVHGAFAGGIGVRGGVSRRVADDFRVPDEPTFAESGTPQAPLFTGQLPHTNFEQTEAYGQVGVAGGWGQVYANYDWWDGANNFLNANGTPTAVAMRNADARVRGSLFAGAFVLKPVLLYQRAGIRRNTQAKTYEEAEANGDWNQDLVNDAWTGRLELQHPAVGGLRGTVGAEFNRQDVTVVKSSIEPSSATRNMAVFAFEEYQFSRVNVSAGIRFDHRRLEAAANALVDRLPPADREAALHRTFTALTGSAGVGVQVAGPLTVALNLSSGFRPPAPLDLYTDEYRPVLGSYVEGNPGLGPERSYSLEASIRYTAARFAGSVIAYHNRLNNYIYLLKTDRTRPRAGRPVPVYVNTQADGWISGIEASGSGEVARRLVVEASYARLRSRNLATGEQLPLMPADYLRASARYAGGRWGVIDAPYVEIGGKYAWAKAIAGPTEPFADADLNPAGPGVGSTPAYAVANLGAGGRLDWPGGAVELYLAVENLFDTAYRDFLDTLKGVALGQGRNLSLRVAVPLSLGR